MIVSLQHTLAAKVSFAGVGVHTGAYATVHLEPAPANAGITLCRVGHEATAIKLGQYVPPAAPHATVIQTPTWRVSTVEHLLAAVWALRIDNLKIVVDGDEIPIFDGSALPFVLLMQRAGVQEQPVRRKYLAVRTRREFVDKERNGLILLTPPLTGVASLALEYEAPTETFAYSMVPELFISTFMAARTYGHLEQLPGLRSHGLAGGATTGNTLVITSKEFLNTPRFSDEPFRHKVLDLIGDCMLLGYPLIGTLAARNTGHNFNRRLVEDYCTNPDQWQLLEAEEPQDIPVREYQK